MIIDGEPGLWAEHAHDVVAPGRPALFLDRDGVIVEEVHFLSKPGDVRLIEGIGEAIARVNRAGLAVVVVTNQSGIARGLFGWAEFAAVQAEIVARLGAAGARLDAVLACGHHASGQPPFERGDHPWRKPGPGMLVRGAEMLKSDLARSRIVGDRVSDLGAGFRAGLAGGWLVMTGYGQGQLDGYAAERKIWGERFSTSTAANAVEAVDRFLADVE